MEDEQKLNANGGKKSDRKAVNLNELVKTFKVENKYAYTSELSPKFVNMEIEGWGLTPDKITPTGLPAVDLSVLLELAGDPAKGIYGRAMD